MELDFGDVVLSIQAHVPGLRQYRMPHRHYGAPRKSTAAERAVPAAPMRPTPERPMIGVQMDLKADQSVDVQPGDWTDERGNPTSAPIDATFEYTVDRSDLLLIDNHGDGSATLTAAGPLGDAVVTSTATVAGRTLTGTDVVSVVAGDAERFTLAFGEPRETTPDDEPAPEE